MGRGIGIVGADGHLDFAHHTPGFIPAAGDHGQGTGPFAVQPEVLGKGTGDHHVHSRLGEGPHGVGILLHAPPESLVGEVQEGQDGPAGEQFHDAVPLRLAGIHSAGIVAAGVEQHHIALGRLLQGLQHRLEAQAVAFRIVVGIAFQLQPAIAEDPVVVGPGGIAQPDGGAGKLPGQKLRPHPQGPRASGSMDGGPAPLGDDGMPRSEEEALHDAGVAALPTDAQVILGGLLFQQDPLRLFDRFQDGIDPALVLVDTRGQIDFPRIIIFAVRFRETEDGIRWRLFHRGEGGIGMGGHEKTFLVSRGYGRFFRECSRGGTRVWEEAHRYGPDRFADCQQDSRAPAGLWGAAKAARNLPHP